MIGNMKNFFSNLKNLIISAQMVSNKHLETSLSDLLKLRTECESKIARLKAKKHAKERRLDLLTEKNLSLDKGLVETIIDIDDKLADYEDSLHNINLEIEERVFRF